MAERYQAWWKGLTDAEVVRQLRKHPKAIVRQLAVACDMAQAPVGSDQETFPTLPPAEAEKLLKQKVGVTKSIVWPNEVEKGKRGPRLGDVALHNDL